jgi:hypothetical protein
MNINLKRKNGYSPMKNFFKYLYLVFIYANHAYAYNPTQQAMEDLSGDSEGGYSNGPFGTLIFYLVLIGLVIAFLNSNFRTKLNVFKGLFLYLFPLFVIYVLKQMFEQDWKIIAFPVVLLYFFKIDSIGKFVFPELKEIDSSDTGSQRYKDENKAADLKTKEFKPGPTLCESCKGKGKKNIELATGAFGIALCSDCDGTGKKYRKYYCPKCRCEEAVQILYGYPLDETLNAWQNKEIELGGCVVSEGAVNRKCRKCNFEWTANKND